MSVVGLDHVQLAAPPGCEPAARHFYGGLLGLVEVDKPAELARRGGVWFLCGAHELHIGVEPEFVAARKAHPALVVAELDVLADRLAAAGCEVIWDDALAGIRRFYTADPWGNRLELLDENGGRARG